VTGAGWRGGAKTLMLFMGGSFQRDMCTP
jgi:hypothetical protein